MRLAAPRRVQLLVERARQALVVADHVRERDPVAPMSQSVSASDERICAASPSTCASDSADVLDPDRRPVEPDGVPARCVELDELVDRAVAIDDEVRARPRQLVQLGVRDVGANVLHADEKLVVAV